MTSNTETNDLLKPLLEIIEFWSGTTHKPVPFKLINMEWWSRARTNQDGCRACQNQLGAVIRAAVEKGLIINITNPNWSRSFRLPVQDKPLVIQFKGFSVEL